MDIGLYINGLRVDLFDDENIFFNSKATDISDIGSIVSDVSLSFNVPASDNNNTIFKHYYESAIDGSINANITMPAYIEIATIPYKVGKIKLEDVKLKNKEPESYNLTFYSSLVGLNETFGDIMLKEIDLSAYDHIYNLANVVEGVQSPTFFDGELIYPLISPERPWRIGTLDDNDIYTEAGAIDYREFKPGVKALKIIEAIETKFGITFTRDFFGTALFNNLYMWLSKEAGRMTSYGVGELVDWSSKSGDGINSPYMELDMTNGIEQLSFTASRTPGIPQTFQRVIFRVTPQSGFDSVFYNMSMTVNGEESFVELNEATGVREIVFRAPPIPSGGAPVHYDIQFYVKASSNFSFQAQIYTNHREYAPTFPFVGPTKNGYAISVVQNLDGLVKVSSQLPEIKIKDWIKGLFQMFNLIIIPITDKYYYVNTLDAYYAAGDIFDITRYVDIEDVKVNPPALKKKIDFRYNKTDNILGRQFRINNGGISDVGYGDLSSTYNITYGDELKISIPFDNMLFERLTDLTGNTASGGTTEIMMGSTIDYTLQPNNNKPVFFFLNGIVPLETPIKIKIGLTYTDVYKIYSIGSDDDLVISQISTTLNYGSEVSPYQYLEIPNGLYYNFWDRYISNIYNVKQRKYNFKVILPINIIQKLSLNDRLNINDKQYRITDFNINLLNGEGTINLYNNFYDAPFKITTEGISRTSIELNSGFKYYDVFIDTDYSWVATKIPVLGDITNTWVELSQSSGNGLTRVTLKILENTTASLRTMDIEFVTNGNTYTLEIQQDVIT
jgi:hypothetical protein